MDVQKILTEAAALVGPSGQEAQVAAYFAEQFRPYVDEVRIDPMFNMIAHKKGTGPKVMLCAHMDEIGLMVSAVEEDGSIRLGQVGAWIPVFCRRAGCGCTARKSSSAPSVPCRPI